MADSTRYTIRNDSANKRWLVCESGLTIQEYLTEQQARKYCDRLNNLVDAHQRASVVSLRDMDRVSS
jgi:hypothetical protein